ncbi:MAG: dihydrolipoyl dehydrogenase [Rickettsiaceae bacterium]|nr:dihydrolipoyl dehydrogenase [Rickettsiaceae bacterium]
MQEFDLVVIGAGPGGYVCAIRAAQLGKKVAIIEANHLGGICLNWGCIPTKSLLRSAEVFHLMQNAKSFGLSAEKISANLKDIVARSRSVASQLSSGIATLLKKANVIVFMGHASFISSSKIIVEGEKKVEISAKKFVIATGARAKKIPAFEPNGVNILTYKEAMTQEALPKALVVIGSGAIGIEFASFYNTLGVDVTVIEAQDRILPVEDYEVSNFAKKSFEKHGMKIFTSASLKVVKSAKSHVDVEFESGGAKHSLKPDKVIMAVGITPNTENLNLKNTKVSMNERGFIQVDAHLKTKDDNIYAIGDMVEGPWLAHKASHEGIIAAEVISGHKTHKLNKKQIPGCTYSMPQIASIGLTEEKAKLVGLTIKVGRFPFAGNGKAIALGEPEGFVKLIFDEKTGELHGAHMIGAEVTELINSMALAMSLEATEEDIMNTIFPHPTLSEMIHESALSAYNRAIHIPNK